ncbi:MAG: hypothetical protein PUC33_02475 [Oscillospiraceae bacterium]|nr:hypothetical protein [Oscillospiraceae bacterium]
MAQHKTPDYRQIAQSDCIFADESFRNNQHNAPKRKQQKNIQPTAPGENTPERSTGTGKCFAYFVTPDKV